MSNNHPTAALTQISSHSKTLSSSSSSSPTSCSQFSQAAGATAAECAVICCCFPCGILHLAFLALYTLPAGICKKLLKRKKMKKRKIMRKTLSCGCGYEADRQVHPVNVKTAAFKETAVVEDEFEVKKLDKEMWDAFYSTGFWRSSSQRFIS